MSVVTQQRQRCVTATPLTRRARRGARRRPRQPDTSPGTHTATAAAQLSTWLDPAAVTSFTDQRPTAAAAAVSGRQCLPMSAEPQLDGCESVEDRNKPAAGGDTWRVNDNNSPVASDDCVGRVLPYGRRGKTGQQLTSTLISSSLLASNVTVALLYTRPHRADSLSDDARLTSVCPSRTSGLSREQRGLGRLKLAQR